MTRTTSTHTPARYVYNPGCYCRVCQNNGQLPDGFKSGDNYEDPHCPPPPPPTPGLGLPETKGGKRNQ